MLSRYRSTAVTADNVYQYGSFKDYLKAQPKLMVASASSKDLARWAFAYKYQKAQAAKRAESFRQKMRKTDVTRAAVQRRAVFESPEQSAAGAGRATTGVA